MLLTGKQLKKVNRLVTSCRPEKSKLTEDQKFKLWLGYAKSVKK